jgi:hypothetical protein
MSGTPMIQMPNTLIIELTPGQGTERGSARLRARDWVSIPAASDLRILPARGDVHFDSESGTYKIEISFSALSTKPPPDPPLIILP